MKTPSPEAMYQEALALLKQGQLSPAKARLDVLAKIAPKQSIVQQQLGLIAQKQLRTKDAVKAFSRAVRLAPGDTRAALLLSDALVSDGQVSEAITLLRKVRHAHPKLVDAHAKLGHALQLAGLFDAASDALMDAISLAPNETQLYRIASVSYNFTQDDPLIAQMERLFRTAADGSPEISNLGFALAKAMEDIKAYDRVFGFLRPANESVRTRFPYSASARREEIQSVQTAFEAARIGTFGASENPVSPIFVTGLPRSGTTLIEQILAAHPDVTGVGEPGFAHRLGRSALGLDASNIVPFDLIST